MGPQYPPASLLAGERLPPALCQGEPGRPLTDEWRPSPAGGCSPGACGQVIPGARYSGLGADLSPGTLGVPAGHLKADGPGLTSESSAPAMAN